MDNLCVTLLSDWGDRNPYIKEKAGREVIMDDSAAATLVSLYVAIYEGWYCDQKSQCAENSI